MTKSVVTGNALELEIVKSNKARPGLKELAFLDYGKGINDLYYYAYKLKKAKILTLNNKYYEMDYGRSKIKEEGLARFVEKLTTEGFTVDDFVELMGKDNPIEIETVDDNDIEEGFTIDIDLDDIIDDDCADEPIDKTV